MYIGTLRLLGVQTLEPAVRYTPPPGHLFGWTPDGEDGEESQPVLDVAAEHVLMVADRMQLRGAATIHTYVQKDYGDVMFTDVYPFADLSPGSLLVHQVRLELLCSTITPVAGPFFSPLLRFHLRGLPGDPLSSGLRMLAWNHLCAWASLLLRLIATIGFETD